MPIFKNLTIAVAGTFDNSVRRDAIERWVENSGGKYSSTVDENVTHLVCSKDAWRGQIGPVKEALKLRVPHIVAYEWLELSLLKHRKRAERPFYLEKVMKNDKKGGRKVKTQKVTPRQGKGKRASRRNQVAVTAGEGSQKSPSPEDLGARPPDTKFTTSALEILQLHQEEWKKNKHCSLPDIESSSATDNGEGDASQDKLPNCSMTATQQAVSVTSLVTSNDKTKGAPGNLNSDAPAGFAIYTDHEGLAHNITLVRIDIRKNRNERFNLQLFESHGAASDSYCVFLRYGGIHIDGKPSVTVVPPGADFETAMLRFKLTYRGLTGKNWEDRDSQTVMKCSGIQPTPTAMTSDAGDDEWPDLGLPAGMPTKADIVKKPFLYAKRGEHRRKPTFAWA